MEKFIPASFPEALGGALAIVAVLSGVCSLIVCLRAHTLRILAILIVASLALFSNHVTTYFVAIFVIATAITELDFLQNLAAIFRGNKEYFDYKKETLSKERKLDIITAEAVQSEVVAESGVNGSSADESAQPSSINTADSKTADNLGDKGERPKDDSLAQKANDKSKNRPEDVSELKATEEISIPIQLPSRNHFPRSSSSALSNDVRRIYELEGRAFDNLELLFERAIEKGVRLRRGRVEVELDGLITKFDGKRDLIFEVKYLRSSQNFLAWIKLIGVKLRSLVVRYKEVTGEDALVHFVLIVEDEVKFTYRQKKALDEIDVRDVSIFTVGFLEKKLV